MSSNKGRKYCSVFGCLNKNSLNPELSFFNIPTEPEQRIQWLRVIDREDLSHQLKLDLRVCEAHFKTEDISVNTKRKRLRKNCLPCLRLPTKKDKETQTLYEITTDNVSSQIDLPTCSLSIKTEKIDSTWENSFQTSLSIKTEKIDSTWENPIQTSIPIKTEKIDSTWENPIQTSIPIKTEKIDSTSENSIPTSLSIKTEKIDSTSENSIQTAASLSRDTPCKRKLKSDLSNLKKRLKVNREIGEASGKSERDMFFELCDRLLSKNLANIVKAQVYQKLSKANRYTLAYKMFCLNLYYARPQVYRILQQTLYLPCKTTLAKLYIPLTTQVNDDLMAALKLKVNNMSVREKQCALVVDAMSLKTNLFYNIKDDKIIGFHEVDGVQLPLPAKHALVVLGRGIFSKWSQAIGFALLSECEIDDNIFKWIEKIMVKLLEVGLKIRVFVSDLGLDLLNAAKKRGISVDKTYFTVNDHKIYYIFDAPHLIKLVRNNLMTYDFHLQNGGVAKYEHIVKFYENDKKSTFRQAYKLTNSHINPTNIEKKKVLYATQLLSRSVAAGLSTYVDFKIIHESARQTVEFIKNMNDLFDILNSSTYRHSYVYKSAFCGHTNQIDFFNNMLMLFRTLKVYNPRNGNDVTKTVKFIDGFQITIKSILQLFDDLKQEEFKNLLTRRLNQDVTENFFGKIRSENGVATEPTSRQFISAYRKIYFSNIIQPPKEGNCCEDLNEFLVNLNNHHHIETGAREIDDLLTSRSDTNETTEQENVLREILRSDYAQLELPEKNAFLYVCGALFKRCVDYHKDCEFLKVYFDSNQRSCNLSAETRYTTYRNYATDGNLLLIPPDDFVANIERMEQIFRMEFEKDHINIKIGTSIYEQLEDIKFTMPCPCFPVSFLKKLYIRMRIYFTLSANNKAFQTSGNRRNIFSVSNF